MKIETSDGWVRIPQTMLDGQSASRGIVYVGAIAWFITSALTRNSFYRGVKIPRGSLFVTVTELVNQWGCTRQMIRTILKNLEADGVIKTNTYPLGTVVTICDYEQYASTEEA